MINVGIVGASGYTGGELLRLLSSHPGVIVKCVSSRTYNGKHISEVFPGLRQSFDLVCKDYTPEQVAEQCDVVFTAVPHGVAMGIAPAVKAAGKRMIDLGADYRFDHAGVYESWYKVKHDNPELLEESVYGLPEIYKDQINGAWLVGNPGCYPTTVILGLAPLLSAGIIDPAHIVVDSKSGVSGAGRKPGPMYHYPECNDNMQAYGVAGHRHTPEIEQELSKIAGEKLTITFTPHLIPMSRGMLSTIYGDIIDSYSVDHLIGLYEDFYADSYFVRVLPPNKLPETKALYGSNYCDIAVRVDKRTNKIMVVVAIDNLVKGSSGQAVQNMNVMFGRNEALGLMSPAVFP